MTLNPTAQAVAREMAAEVTRQGRQQKQVAAAVGLSEQAISRRITTGSMGLGDALRIADELGVELGDLVARAPRPSAGVTAV